MYPKEKEFADLLNKQHKKWIYPTKRFNLGKTTYRPDFYLPNERLYIEVVGSRQAFHANKNKIILFKKLFPHIKFIIVDYKNNPLPYNNPIPKNLINNNYPLIPYYDTFIPYKPGHKSGKCGNTPLLCPTCKAIKSYWKHQRYLKLKAIQKSLPLTNDFFLLY
jgi:hypothetical protein